MSSGLLFALIWLCYFMSYVSRKNIVFITPHLIQHTEFTKADLGASQSLFSVAYTVSKLLSNIVCNWAPPRVVLTIGITCVGIVNILAGVLDSPQYLWLLWGVNGLCCGICWPPIAVLLVSHFSNENRGKIWSLVSSSMNVGATLCPIMTDTLIKSGSWHMSFYVPGVVDAVLGFAVFTLTHCEAPYDIRPTTKPEQPPETRWNRDMMFNKFMVLICTAYTILTFAIITMGTWGQMYFIEMLGTTTLLAGAIISVYEIGGFCGATLSGFFADYITKYMKHTSASPRAYSALLFSFIACISSSGLYFLPVSYTVSQICSFGFGFGCFGTVAMFGLMIREYVPMEHGGTLSAALAVASQVGGFSAGSPLAWYNESYSISAGFALVTCVMPVPVVFMLMLTTVSGRYKQKTE